MVTANSSEAIHSLLSNNVSSSRSDSFSEEILEAPFKKKKIYYTWVMWSDSEFDLPQQYFQNCTLNAFQTHQ